MTPSAAASLKTLHIAVGVISRAAESGARDICISQRREGKPGAGQWEFPGGKVDSGETVLQALKRELHEELGITVQRAEPLITITHAYPDRVVVLDTWNVQDFVGEPRGLEGQAVRWVPAESLDDSGLLEADGPIVSAILLPQLMAITPPGADATHVRRQLQALESTGAAALLRIRKPRNWESLEDVLSAAPPRVSVIVDNDAPQRLQMRAAGVHYSADAVRARGGQPVSRYVPRQWVGASAHTAEELAAAHAIGADYCLLGAVYATSSHPSQAEQQEHPRLGWDGFRKLARGCNMPVFAVGGLSPEDRSHAAAHGAQGVAGIRAFGA